MSASPGMTAGVRTLLGDPKAAIRALAWPMMVAMALQTLYNLADTIWVAGLGADALAAVGFVFPFFFAVFGLANGLGVGAGSAISRRIGRGDKAGADQVAVHTMVLLVAVSVVITIAGVLGAPYMSVLTGPGPVAEMTTQYAQVIFYGTIFMLFTAIVTAMLRSEGDAKRAMYVMVASSLVNIILDPIFIYGLGMGVAGAAWATIVSFIVAVVPMVWWLFIRRDTYVSVPFSGFRFQPSVIREILSVGLPAAFMQVSMAATTVCLNVIIMLVATTDGVAIYSTGWRVVMIAITPLIAITTAVVSVSGAAYGARDYLKMEIGHLYAIKLGFGIGCVIAVLTFIFAPQIALAFTFSEGAAHLYDELVFFIRVICIFYPTTALGMFSSALFQGTGKGINALIVTLLRTIVLTVAVSYGLAVVAGWGLHGVWWGLVIGNVIGSLTAFAWARLYTKNLKKGAAEQGAQTSVHA
jgi:putative MATE family efflux protein